MSKPIGFILTITGLTLAAWFFQMITLPGPAPLHTFPVGAIALAMISVGVRYVLKGMKADKIKNDRKKAEKAAKKAAKQAQQEAGKQGPAP
jgi:hypothetical protein